MATCREIRLKYDNVTLCIIIVLKKLETLRVSKQLLLHFKDYV